MALGQPADGGAGRVVGITAFGVVAVLVGVEALADSPFLPGLTWLDLKANRITGLGARALIDSDLPSADDRPVQTRQLEMAGESA